MKNKMSPNEADGLILLILQANRYFRHPDVERILGFQVATRQSINLEEIADYLRDHVLSENGEDITTKDRRMIATTLSESAKLLEHPEILKIRFALGTKPFAQRLRDAATRIVRTH